MVTLTDLDPGEIIMYLRKSRTDDPSLTVAETLSRHEQMLDDFSHRTWGSLVPEQNRFREVVSGETIDARPEIQRVLRLLEQPRFRGLLIVEPQRISRGDLEDIGRVSKILRYTDTLVITLQGCFDLGDERDRSWFEQELKRGNDYLEYSKRIMRNGRELSCERGHYIGSRDPFGYRRVFRRDGKRKYPTLDVATDEAAIVLLIYQLYAEGVGATRICQRLNAAGSRPQRGDHWTPSCIYPILDNPLYAGKIRWGARKTVRVVEDGELRVHAPRHHDCPTFEGKHEAIVPDDLWDAVRAIREAHEAPRVKSGRALQNPLSGLLRCSCGHMMIRRPYGGRCADRYQCPEQAVCGNASCTMDEMHAAVVEALRGAIEDFSVQLDDASPGPSRSTREQHLRVLRSRLSDAERKETALWEKYAEGMPRRVFDELLAKVERQKSGLAEQIAAAVAENDLPDLPERLVTFSAALDAISDPDVPAAAKNTLLKSCIKRITYRRERGERKKGRVQSRGWAMPPMQLDIELLL